MINAKDCGASSQQAKEDSAIWSIDRQVRFVSGVLVLVGIALGFCLHPNWLLFSVLVSLGMIVSAVTGSCALGGLLGLLPCNRRRE